MKSLSGQVHSDIVSLLDAGLSLRQIAAHLGVGCTAVHKVRAATRPDMQKSRGGRPAKLTAADKRWLSRMITSGKADTAPQLTQNLRNNMSMEISTETVRNALKEAGLKAKPKQKKPRILPKHRRQRMDFAIRYQHWTKEDWKCIIWSDETKINRLGPDGRKWVWKKPGERALTDRFVQGTMKYGGGSLMMWGCMTAQGVGHACRIDGGMDAALYTSILNDELMKTMKDYRLDQDSTLFQHDNDPKHTSAVARKCLKKRKIKVLDWPTQSPDLNPIEQLWQHLKRQLANYETEPAGVCELWERVETEWNKIPRQVCVDLIESMPRRVHAVLKAKGGYTKY